MVCVEKVVDENVKNWLTAHVKTGCSSVKWVTNLDFAFY